MWRVLERKGEQLYLSDKSGERKWVSKEMVEEIQKYAFFSQYFLSLDMKQSDIWFCPISP